MPSGGNSTPACSCRRNWSYFSFVRFAGWKRTTSHDAILHARGRADHTAFPHSVPQGVAHVPTRLGGAGQLDVRCPWTLPASPEEDGSHQLGGVSETELYLCVRCSAPCIGRSRDSSTGSMALVPGQAHRGERREPGTTASRIARVAAAGIAKGRGCLRRCPGWGSTPRARDCFPTPPHISPREKNGRSRESSSRR